jgi:hypothetical protein
MTGRGSGVGIDQAVLEELRAIRAEIHDLSDRVAASATRAELDRYVTVDRFASHEQMHAARTDGWRAWAPFALSAVALLFVVVSTLASHVVLR